MRNSQNIRKWSTPVLKPKYSSALSTQIARKSSYSFWTESSVKTFTIIQSWISKERSSLRYPGPRGAVLSAWPLPIPGRGSPAPPGHLLLVALLWFCCCCCQVEPKSLTELSTLWAYFSASIIALTKGFALQSGFFTQIKLWNNQWWATSFFLFPRMIQEGERKCF